MSAPTVAIVGAGMAGATAARALVDAGLTVEVFEKSRGAGGRMSTRRAPPRTFDHGAQYITTRTPAFERAMHAWVEIGVAAPWAGRLVDLEDGRVRERGPRHPRYVGVPGMNAICKHLLAGVPLHRGVRIGRIEREDGRWHLRDTSGASRGRFDVVIVTAPPEQSAELLHDAPRLAADVARAELAPCWTWMAAFDQPLDLPFEGAFVQASPLGWIARDDSKPGRPGAGETWIAQATAAWSTAHVDDDPDRVARVLAETFRHATGRNDAAPTRTMVHRWLYAYPVRDLGTPCLWDEQRGIGVCGDWVLGERVESAWMSGRAMADAVLASRRDHVS